MVLPVDPHLYATFLGVMAVMAITPGPANVFSVANGIQRGKAGAMAGVIGMNAATLVWFGAAALGLGALVVAFPDVFRFISVAGALYVGWLGYKALRGGCPNPELARATPC
jgi:threonine/homoserine/homoserine lactone efflux protein